MKPKIVIYCCTNSILNPEEGMEKVISEYPAEIQISRLPCSGHTDVLYLLRAIERGATMAMIVGCPEGQCQFLEGSRRAGLRVRYANRLLEEAGLGRERIRMVTIDHGDASAFLTALQETVVFARTMGSRLPAMV